MSFQGRRFGITFLLLTILLSACGPSRLTASVESFSAPAAVTQADMIFLVPAVPAERETLEHRSWVLAAERELTRRGFKTTNNRENATVLASIILSIDGGREITTTSSIPQFGVVGYSAANTFGTVNRVGSSANFSSTTTLTPQFGVTGHVPVTSTQTRFRRFGAVQMSRMNSPSDISPVFESRVTSEGTCGLLSVVANPLIEALFATFPAGGTRRMEVPIPSAC